jgi:hypothetical protein
MRKTLTGMLCTVLCSSIVQADGGDSSTGYAAAETVRPAWQSTSLAMSDAEYRRSVDRNRDIVKEQMNVYADRLLERAGEYGKAVSLFGAVAAVAATDRRYNLNDSKTLGMVLRDTASSNRTVLLEFRKAW